MSGRMLAVAIALLLVTRPAAAFDHDHGQFKQVLADYVQWQEDGNNSRVDYAGLQSEPKALERYLAGLSAVNCASIGCPALRPEPFTAGNLESQLEDSTQRFLGNTSRNRYRDGQLALSPIFKWYREDFERGWRGADTLGEFLARYADALKLDAETRERLADGGLEIRFLDYDWNLNRLETNT